MLVKTASPRLPCPAAGEGCYEPMNRGLGGKRGFDHLLSGMRTVTPDPWGPLGVCVTA